MVRLILAVGITILTFTESIGQNKFYVGFEMGPKMERHTLNGGYTQSGPIDLVHTETVKPILGVTGGLLIDNAYMLRLGVLKTSDEIRLGHQLNTGGGSSNATPLNIYDGYLFPVNFAFCKNLDETELPAQIRFGTGITIFGGIQSTTPKNVLIQENPDEFQSDLATYTIKDNFLDAQLNAFNLMLEFAKPTSAQMEFQASLLGRLGVSGSNYVDIEGSSITHGQSIYRLKSSGTGWQLTFGFKYYFTETETVE